MSTNAQSQAYPFSTREGDAIPLEIIRPRSLVQFTMPAGTPVSVTIPQAYGSCYVYSTKDCILQFATTALPAALVSGTEYFNAMIIPANTLLNMMATPGAAQLLCPSGGVLTVVSIDQWAVLKQQNQLSIG